MIVRNILIGLGAGLAAALLFAGLVTGTTLALPLFLLSPLPIAIAGLGFGTIAGAVGAVLAAALIGGVLSPHAGAMHLFVFGAPVALAAHWIGLSRGDGAEPAEREWFPLDRVLLRIALAGGVGVVIAGVMIGYDPASWKEALLATLKLVLADGTVADAPTEADLAPIVEIMVTLMPVSSAVFAVAIVVLNCWLGARIARLSGQLQRPWTPIWTIVLPRFAFWALVAAVAAAFLPGSAGHIGAAFVGAIAFAFALSGFGWVHAVLAGKPLKGLVLTFLYAFTLLFSIPILLAALVGIADTMFGLRSRQQG